MDRNLIFILAGAAGLFWWFSRRQAQAAPAPPAVGRMVPAVKAPVVMIPQRGKRKKKRKGIFGRFKGAVKGAARVGLGVAGSPAGAAGLGVAFGPAGLVAAGAARGAA